MRALAALLVFLTACDTPEPEAAPEPTPAEAKAEKKEDFSGKMQEHFTLVTDARMAVLLGDLPGARAHMSKLAAMDPPDVPDGWAPHVTKMKEIAIRGTEAKDLDAASQEVAMLGYLCGTCHLGTGGGPRADVAAAIANPDMPEDTHMRQHLWSTERMWLGLVSGNWELYDSGAKSLAGMPLYPGVAEGDEALPEGFIEDETQVHELGKKAATATDKTEKARTAGTILATCSGCHSKFGAPPPVLGELAEAKSGKGAAKDAAEGAADAPAEKAGKGKSKGK